MEKFSKILCVFVCILESGFLLNVNGDSAGTSNTAAIVRGLPFPLAPPPVCIEEGATGFINDTCQTDADCYDSTSMTCTNKRCQCAIGNSEDPSLPKGSKRRVCQQTPGLASICLASICQKPYECKSGVTRGLEGAASMVMPPGNSNEKTCQCPGKSKYVNGICDGGCKDGQRLGNGGQCVARCTKNQILIDNECKSMANLGDACVHNSQCIAGFSLCQDGKCSCTSGFSGQGQKCVPKTYSCPFGDPLQKGNSVVQCEGSSSYYACMGPSCPMPMGANMGEGGARVAIPPSSPVAASIPNNKAYKTDSCPSTHYCNTYDNAGLKSRGHCCPKSPAKCPVGEVHPTASCSGGGVQCPYTTHSCINVGPSAPFDVNSQMCCPKPCQGYEKVFIRDQCLPVVDYADACQYDEQCQRANGVCSNGKCACGPRSKLVDTGFGPKYCDMMCNSDEWASGTECKPRLKLGDSCSISDMTGTMCPSGAYCNRKGVCACTCGYQKINDKFCAPPSYCPGQSPQQTPINVKNTTFCKLDGSGQPPLAAADSCPQKTFCTGYVENMGICCPIPDPFCPDGSKPMSNKSCNSSDPQTCGSNAYCNVYYMASTNGPSGKPKQGSVCCSLSGFVMPSMVPVPPSVPMASPLSDPLPNSNHKK